MAWNVPFEKPESDSQYVQNANDAAFKLFRSYIASDESPKATELFSKYQSVYFFLTGFLRHCVGQLFGITDPAVLGSIRIDLRSLPKGLVKNGDGTPVSWLYHAGDTLPRIYLDYTLLEEQIGCCEIELMRSTQTTMPSPQDAWARYRRARMTPLIAKLILHEIGHFVLHWNRDNPGPAHNFVPDMPEQFEYHAWAFAGLVIGLAIGHVALEGRNSNGADTAWKHLLAECHQLSKTN